MHVGQAAFRTTRQFTELGGEDAILIHRLLKNTISAKEYLVLTDAFCVLSGGLPDRSAEARTEACEGIGPAPVQVY